MASDLVLLQDIDELRNVLCCANRTSVRNFGNKAIGCERGPGTPIAVLP